MSRSHASSKFVFLFVLVLALVVGGFGVDQDQFRTLGKPTPTPLWKANISGNIYGSTDFVTNQYVFADITTPTKDNPAYIFRFKINYPAAEKLMFSNIGIASQIIGEGISKFVDGADGSNGIANFLNGNSHPEGNVYKNVMFHIQLAAADVDGMQIGASKTLDLGVIYLSFHADDVFDTLFGFTPVDGLYVEKTANGWKFVINQPLNLKEQHNETYTYYQGTRKRTGTRTVTPRTVVTNPVQILYTFVKN